MSALDNNEADEMLVLGQVVRAMVMLGGALLLVDEREDGRRVQFRVSQAGSINRLTIVIPRRSVPRAVVGPASPWSLRLVADADGTPAHMLAWARTGGSTSPLATATDGVHIERSAYGWRASLDVSVDTRALTQETHSGLFRGRLQEALATLDSALSDCIAHTAP